MTKKEIALHFLELAAQGSSRRAFDLYVGEGFKHHNVHYKGDGKTLMEAMEENAIQFPDKIFKIHCALEDGDLVAVHSRVRPMPGDLGAAVMHIFRFEKKKIVELWDFGQAVPKESLNENGMF